MPKENYFGVHEVLQYLNVSEEVILKNIAHHKTQIKNTIESTPWTFIQPHVEDIELLLAQLNQVKSITAFINGRGYKLEDK